MIDEKKLLEEMQEEKKEIKAERSFNEEFYKGFCYAMAFVRSADKVIKGE